jgi:hypothetical protein
MTRRSKSDSDNVVRIHGPENADVELRKAYNCVIETGVTHFWDRRSNPGVNAHEVVTTYKHAFKCHREGNLLAAERWARVAKHLARAIWHESKISYIEPRIAELPFIEGATEAEYNLHERPDTTSDLLDSVADHVPPGMQVMPDEMRRYLVRGRKHLQYLAQPDYHNELLRAERIKAAHEYGRVLECMALAYEAEAPAKAA